MAVEVKMTSDMPGANWTAT